MSAIERYRELVVEALRTHADGLVLGAEHFMETAQKWGHIESIRSRNMRLYSDVMNDVEALSEVIAELERESTRAGGGT